MLNSKNAFAVVWEILSSNRLTLSDYMQRSRLHAKLLGLLAFNEILLSFRSCSGRLFSILHDH